MSLAGIILAGGASTRMGTPKALLEFQGETFADRLIRLFQSCCDPVIVVLGHEPERLRDGIRNSARFVVNSGYRHGQLSSLQCALRSLPPETGAFLFMPVDLPAVKEDTVGLLSKAAAALQPGGIVVPRHSGRHGHPVLCSATLVPEFLALAPDGQARTVVHRHRDQTLYLDVDDPGILKDVDDPAAYRDLIGAS